MMTAALEYYRQLWNNIHTKAVNTSSPEYCTWIRQLIMSMTCPSCRLHAVQYINTNPPEQAFDLFTWSWEFHNNVNARLNKPIMDYETAKIKYSVK
jgi:hypothetical protein